MDDMLYTNGYANKRFTGNAKETEFDRRGKEYGTSFLTFSRYSILPSREGLSDYDLIATRDNTETWFEVECRGPESWDSEPFKWDTMHVGVRKHRSHADFYIQFSWDGSRGGIIRMEDAKTYPITPPIWCKNSKTYENFYDVDVKAIRFFHRTADGWAWDVQT